MTCSTCMTWGDVWASLSGVLLFLLPLGIYWRMKGDLASDLRWFIGYVIGLYTATAVVALVDIFDIHHIPYEAVGRVRTWAFQGGAFILVFRRLIIWTRDGTRA